MKDMNKIREHLFQPSLYFIEDSTDDAYVSGMRDLITALRDNRTAADVIAVLDNEMLNHIWEEGA